MRMLSLPKPRSGSVIARWTSCRMSSSERAVNWKIWLRLTSGEFTEKNGFSVVAPTRMICPGLDIGQKNILLGPIEPVDLVQEQHGSLSRAAQSMLGSLKDGSHLLHTDPGRVELFKMAARVGCDELGKRGLARSRRAIENDAGQAISLQHAA